MASHTCEQCGSIVAKDEQFCPSCGAFIDPMKTQRPAPRRTTGSDKVISIKSDGDSTSSDPGYETFSLDDPPPPDPRTTTPPPAAPSENGRNGDEIACPSCGAVNPGNNRHCQECGARLRQGPLPTAPRPAVQATAGVRAALAISGLLLGVILIALFFNIFNGDEPAAEGTTTTTPTTVAQPENPEPIDILEENCDPEGISGLICSNLTSGLFGQGNEYQVNWEELENGKITIELAFREPMAITEIEWVNIDDETRFRQNYRAKEITIQSQDSVTSVAAELSDDPGRQIIPYSSLNTTKLVIEVIDAYLAEVVADNSFDELAIDEIIVIGRPVIGTGTTAPANTDTTTPADSVSTSSTAG